MWPYLGFRLKAHCCLASYQYLALVLVLLNLVIFYNRHFWGCMLLHTKRKVDYTVRNLFVVILTAVCFRFFLKLKWWKTRILWSYISQFLRFKVTYILQSCLHCICHQQKRNVEENRTQEHTLNRLVMSLIWYTDTRHVLTSRIELSLVWHHMSWDPTETTKKDKNVMRSWLTTCIALKSALPDHELRVLCHNE